MVLAAVLVAVQILAGDEAVFMELRSILGTWYCMLISMLLYTNPTVQATDLQYHAHVSAATLLSWPLVYTFGFSVLCFVGQIIDTFIQCCSLWVRPGGVFIFSLADIRWLSF